MKYLILLILTFNFADACRINIISSGITYNYVQNNVYTVEPQIRIRRANQCRTLILEVTPNGRSQFEFRGGGFNLPISVNFDINNNFNSQSSVVTQRINPVANGTYSYPFYFSLINTTIPTSRRYNSRFSLRVYEQENPSVTLASRNNRHRLEVPPIFNIDFSDSDNTVDFGTLNQGKSANIQMRIDGNIGYRVSMRSDEGGVLKNVSSPDTINYVLSWQGRNLSLSQTYSVIGTYGQGQQVGLINAIIQENTSNKADGNYKDLIEVLVETQ